MYCNEIVRKTVSIRFEGQKNMNEWHCGIICIIYNTLRYKCVKYTHVLLFNTTHPLCIKIFGSSRIQYLRVQCK